MLLDILRSATTAACQTCHLLPRCAFYAEIHFAGKTDTYRQEAYFFKEYDHLLEMKAHDANKAEDEDEDVHDVGAEAPLTLITRSKHCMSKSPHCPTGNIFRADDSLFGEFNPEKAFTGSLPYTGKTRGFSYTEYNPVAVLESLITRGGLTDDPRYRQHYTMRLAECDGKPFLTLPRGAQVGMAVMKPVTHGLPMLYIEGLRHLASARFNLILYRELTATVSIGLESSLKKKNDEERKEERTKQNQEAGYKPSHGGWTKHTSKYQIKSGVTIEGEVLSVIGRDRYGYTAALKKEFTKNKNKLTLLNAIDKGFNMLNSALQKGKNNQIFPLVSAEFCYPKLEITGGVKTVQSDTAGVGVITEGNISVGFAPFFGFKITLDLLTALSRFLGPYGHVVNTVRTAAAAQEDTFKEGGDGVYAILKLELIFSFGVHGGYKFKTNDYGKFKSDGRSIGLQGEIVGDAHVEGGVRVFGVGGFFEAGAEIKSTLTMDFDKEEGDDLTAVVYHEGVKAKVYVKVSRGQNSRNKGKDDVLSTVEAGKFEEWIIYEALDKDDSEWRFSLG
ncbi:hypothetical protein [Morganella sp. GD04133]|uniref:hypothetical protein n=1 Tax=Morganella sp. GD04133 TaxID=2975435 RepID=UPI00244AC6B3|nr:hypothetical protein [Morganella sp. GD04133]MDH0357038.1 hypothetical protein [Morganella sp. GD04133]